MRAQAIQPDHSMRLSQLVPQACKAARPAAACSRAVS
ncbi:Uncharacterised protein [Bordetella pertussis]|nr:Uncharacterised protein [Bordetella pertussis]